MVMARGHVKSSSGEMQAQDYQSTSSLGGKRKSKKAVKMEDSRRIFLYKNGDTYTRGRKIVVNQRCFKNFEQFLASITHDVGLTCGAVRKVFDQTGKRIESVRDLRDDGIYVAAGNEPFRSVSYAPPHELAQPETGGPSRETGPAYTYFGVRSNSQKRKLLLRLPLLSEKPSDALSQSNEKPIFSHTTKGFRVSVFISGDPLSPPFRLVLSHRNCRTHEQLLDELTLITRPKEGSVKRIYDAETYRQIKSLQDLHDGQNLIVCGVNEPARRMAYPLIDFSAQTDVRRITQLAGEKQRIITLFPNGDVMQTGIKIAVTSFRFKDFKRLMDFISNEVLLYTGRGTTLYTTDGKHIDSLDQIVHNGNYVAVSGSDPFKAVQYNSDAYKRAVPKDTHGTMSRAQEILEKSKNDSGVEGRLFLPLRTLSSRLRACNIRWGTSNAGSSSNSRVVGPLRPLMRAATAANRAAGSASSLTRQGDAERNELGVDGRGGMDECAISHCSSDASHAQGGNVAGRRMAKLLIRCFSFFKGEAVGPVSEALDDLWGEGAHLFAATPTSARAARRGNVTNRAGENSSRASRATLP